MIAKLDASVGRRRWTLALVLVLLLTAVGIRWLAIASKPTISHDEAISYLAATCHQQSFGDVEQTLKPIPASEWKQFTRVDQAFCFRQISQGMAATDVHPPLYFWLLHLWSLLIGVHVWTGPSLNVFIALLTIALLYKFAIAVFDNRVDAVLTVVVYTLTISVLVISLDARQYDLLALVALALIASVWRIVRQEGSPKAALYVLVVLFTCLGALIHFHFIFAASAAAVYAAICLVRRDRARLVIIILAIAVGYIIAMIIFPIAEVILNKASHTVGGFNFAEFDDRVVRVILTFRYFYHVLLIGLVIFVIFTYQFLKSDRQEFFAMLRLKDFSGIETLFFALWIGFGISLLYIGFLTPEHAIGDQYLSMVWPFMAFLPVIILRAVKYRSTVALFLYLVPIILFLALIVQLKTKSLPKPIQQLAGAEVVLIDNTARGILIPIIWQIPDDQMVLIGSQEFLIKNSQEWIENYNSGSLYISIILSGSTDAGRQQLLNIMKNGGFKTVNRGSPFTYRYSEDSVIYEIIGS